MTADFLQRLELIFAAPPDAPHLCLCRDVQVLDALVLVRHGGHLVKVCGKEAGCLDRLDDVLRDGPRQSESVERGCSYSRKEKGKTTAETKGTPILKNLVTRS